MFVSQIVNRFNLLFNQNKKHIHMYFNRLFISVFLFISIVVFPVSAQNSLLWKISGNGLKQPSYLYGTIHMICAEDFSITPQAQAAFKNSGKLVLEVDLSQPSVMQKMQTASINKNFHNFKGDIPETDARYIDSCLMADMKMGLKQLGMLKPWALMMAYSMTTAINCSDKKTYETEFIKLAKEQHKSIGELETAEFQLAIFDSIPFQKQIEWLLKSMCEKDVYKVQFDQMIAAYKSQDINKLHQLTMDDEEMKEFADVLFFQRNKNWISGIEALAKEQSCFIAVGAGHLGGEGGLIDLLKKQGFKVKPVKK
jgi:uncharacterized protein YbaP (TraB family)